MHWVYFDGYRLPKQISGHPALEFCNTRAQWTEGWTPDNEWLKDYDTFAVWSVYNELLPEYDTVRTLAAADPHAARQQLETARRLRQALYAVLRGNRPTATTVEIITSAAELAAGRLRLTPSSTARFQWQLADPARLGAPVDAVASAAADLLCSTDLPAIRACPGGDCGWLFLDHRGRRRWCSMSACGNRAKVRAFARRAKK